MYSSRMLTACSLQYGGLPDRDPWTETPLDRDSLLDRHPRTETPMDRDSWTETPPVRDPPLDRDPLEKGPSGQRLQIETPLGQRPPVQRTPCHVTCDVCWDRDPHPPLNRMTHRCKNITLPQTSLQAVIMVLYPFFMIIQTEEFMQ